MSSLIDTSTSLKPIYEAQPDMRFGTTFLSNKYRDFAVDGEVIMDKVTGEIFVKRKEDSRVVSFFQNKKYLHDMMLELRVLLNNNTSFRYPSEDDTTAYYVSTDYDIMSIFDERNEVDITLKNIIIPNDSTAYHQLRFNISTKSNGFFCRITSRDSDRAIIEWVTNQYNNTFKDYDGSNTIFIEESNKFRIIEKWEDSNAVINYDVIVTKNGETSTYNFTDYIRVNEESCVMFPLTMGIDMLSNASSVVIQINTVKFEKLAFMLQYKASMPTEFINGYDKFIYPDKSILIRYINICSFVDKSSDITLLGNEFIIALVDIPYINRYMMKMSKLTDDSSIIVSPTRPSDDVWKTNGIWAEEIRTVTKSGTVTKLESEVDLDTLERFIANNYNTTIVNMTEDSTDTDNIFVKEV